MQENFDVEAALDLIQFNAASEMLQENRRR